MTGTDHESFDHGMLERWLAASQIYRFNSGSWFWQSQLKQQWELHKQSMSMFIWTVSISTEYLPFFSVMPSMLKPSSRPFFQPPLSPPTLATEVRPDLGMFTWHCLILSCDKRQVWRSSGLGVVWIIFVFLLISWFHLIHNSRFNSRVSSKSVVSWNQPESMGPAAR